MADRHSPHGLLCVGTYGLVSLHLPLRRSEFFLGQAAVAIGIAAGMLIASLQPIRADKERPHLVRAPGGPLTLVLILSGCSRASTRSASCMRPRPDLFAEPRFWLTELALSGVLTGMFVGRFAGLWRQYRAAPHEDLSAVA